MPIYKGNSRILNVYKGNTIVGRVYKGSTLVYQKGLRLYKYGDYGLIGGMTTSNPIYRSSINFVDQITAINGTLGTSGSSVVTNHVSTGTSYSWTDYRGTIAVNGVIVFVYAYASGLVSNASYLYIMQGSTIGNYGIICRPASWSSIPYPSQANSSQMIWDGYTFNRDSSQDKTWTINGVY